MTGSKVLVVLGSDSDFAVMEPCFRLLRNFGIQYDACVCSAHRSPRKAAEIASQARDDGYKVIIAAAGLAAHLPGVLAAYTILPVIGVPICTGALCGTDALYSIAQMPAGVPVAAVAIDGAANAAILAAQILALCDEQIEKSLLSYKTELEMSVELRNERLADKLLTIGE
jgi:5-(carboxyamino)imidazole ribonucleotide mutase